MAFKATRLLSPQKVNQMQPTIAEVDISAFPFIDMNLIGEEI